LGVVVILGSEPNPQRVKDFARAEVRQIHCHCSEPLPFHVNKNSRESIPQPQTRVRGGNSSLPSNTEADAWTSKKLSVPHIASTSAVFCASGSFTASLSELNCSMQWIPPEIFVQVRCSSSVLHSRIESPLSFRLTRRDVATYPRTTVPGYFSFWCTSQLTSAISLIITMYSISAGEFSENDALSSSPTSGNPLRTSSGTGSLTSSQSTSLRFGNARIPSNIHSLDEFRLIIIQLPICRISPCCSASTSSRALTH
jgi:hypothetical protein